MFKGERIEIAAKSFIEMEWEEGIELKGQFTGLAPLREDGSPDPRFFKKIRVEAPPTPAVQADPLVCQATGQRAASAEELAAMIAQFADRRVKDPEAEKAAAAEAATLKAENDALKERLAAIEAKLGLGGRPRKEAVG